MEKFRTLLLKKKLVSVWGIGYLGYTELIKLQSKGFSAKVSDFTDTSFTTKIKRGDYLDKEKRYNWSAGGSIPPLDLTKIKIVKSEKEMFGTNVHIIAFPAVNRGGKDLLGLLAKIFIKNKAQLEGALVLFLSAGVPGNIRKQFIAPLQKSGCRCSFASAFRSDWVMEDFLRDSRPRILAADSLQGLAMAKSFFDAMEITTKNLGTVEEAELYENSKNTLQYMVTMFINQLAFAYPNINMRKMTSYLLRDVALNESHLNIGAGSVKLPISVDNILRGSSNPNVLSLINETEGANINLILSYAELLKKNKCASAVILGISVRSNQRNIDVSPSIMIAEYLHKLGLRVWIDDPFYSDAVLKKIAPFARPTDIIKDGFKADALVVMTDHDKYKYLSQEDINRLGIRNAHLVIDNNGLFQNFSFSPKTKYHVIGDGKLGGIC